MSVVRRVFAIQAQDPVGAALGIRVRGRGITADAVRGAYANERSVVTGWFMRGTLHTVAAEDYHWLLALYGPRNIALGARRCRELGLTDDLLERAGVALRRSVESNGPQSRPQLTEVLASLGIPADGQAPFHAIRHAVLSGVLCSTGNVLGAPEFALLRDWVPRPAESPASPLGELAARYLRAHGPAGVEDFTMWSGLPVTAVRPVWRAAAGLGELAPVPATPDIRLLPAYDNYLLSHRDRTPAVPPEHAAAVYPGGGQIRPTVLTDGRVTATWTRKAAHIDVAWLDPADHPAIASELASTTTFLQDLLGPERR